MNNDIIIKVSKMYGLNDCSDFDLKVKSKNTLIYGYNAVGKSSVAKAIGNIVSKVEYKPQLTEDSETFSFNLQFDNLNINYDEKTDINSLPDISKKVYIYHKNYAKNNIYSGNNEEELPEIGIRINEKKTNVEVKNSRLLEYKKELKSGIKIVGSAQKDFKDDSILSQILKTANQEEIMEKIINSLKSLSFKLDISSFVASDFKNTNLEVYNQFKLLIEQINKELIERIKDFINKEEYTIESVDDLSFYQYLIGYFSSKDTLAKCPVCLNDNFDYEKIQEKIRSVIDDYLSKGKLDKLNEYYKEYIETTKSSSIIFNNIKEIIVNVFNGIFLEEKINTTTDLIDALNNNYDELLFEFANLKKENLLKESEELDKSNAIISEIDELNKELNNGQFITCFTKMLDILFNKDEIHVDATLNDFSISLNVGLKNKKSKDFHMMFDSILSESQKAKISLAFFFAIIIFQNGSTNNKILCVFDDPIDSYDSLSKYELSRIIYEFTNNISEFEIYTYDCYPLIFTHSSEYLRLFNENFYEDKEFHVFTKNGLFDLDSEKLFLFEGDFTTLTELMKKSKIKLDEMISVSPILRELAAHSAKNFKDNANININLVNNLNKKLSDDLIHGLFRNNIDMNGFVNLVNSYRNISIDCTGYSNNYLKVIIRDIIENNRRISLNFYEEVVLKNTIAIYIRAMFDEVLIRIIVSKNYLPGKTIDEIHHEYMTIGRKLKVSTLETDYPLLSNYIRSCLSMFNDFGHSANNYLTPLIDVRLERLYDIYDEFYNFVLDDKSIVSSYL